MPETVAPATNWAGNVTYGAARVHRPDTVDELRRLVAGSRRIRALGTGHSFSRVADTPDDLVRLDRLPRSVEADPAAGTVTVSAATTYAELAEALHRAGLALGAMASLPHISVAGSCATGTHGSGDGQRCLAAAVRALELVGADGSLVQRRRDVDPDFPGLVVGLGAVGVVTRLTLDVEPAYAMRQRVRVDVPLDDVAAGFDEVLGAASSVSVFTDWRGGTARVWLKERTDRPTSGWDGGRPAAGSLHPVSGLPPEACTPQLGVPGPWHERLPHFRADVVPSVGRELQSEYYLPRSAAPAALAAVREVGDVVAPVLHVSEVRTVRGDDLWLSPAYGRDSVTVHFTWVQDLDAVLPAIVAVEERLVPLGARPHWGKLTTMAPAEVLARYERAGDVARLLRDTDPAGTFRNPFVAALVGAR